MSDPTDPTTAAASHEPAPTPPQATADSSLPPVPPPERQPGERPPSKVWRWLAGLATVGVLLMVAAAVAGTIALSRASQDLTAFPDGIGAQDPVSLIHGAWWVGDGAYAVAQTVGADRVPLIVVWSRVADSSRTLAGYRVVAVEPHSARVWVAPLDRLPAKAADTYVGPSLMGDGSDAPVAKLAVLDLASSDLRPAPAPSGWESIQSSSGVSAALTVSADRGALPSGLRFSDKAGRSVAAQLPRDTQTFTPLGFSPSGRYFAVYPSVPASESPQPGERVAPLTIFSAETGKVVARAGGTSGDSSTGDTEALWDAARDVIYFADVRPMTNPNDPNGNEVPTLQALTPDGIQQDAFVRYGWKMPAEFQTAMQGRLLGMTISGPLYALETESGTIAYHVTPGGLVRAFDLQDDVGGGSSAATGSDDVLSLEPTVYPDLQRLWLSRAGEAERTLWQQGSQNAD